MKNNVKLYTIYLLVLAVPFASNVIAQKAKPDSVGILVFGDSGNIEGDPSKSALMPVANAMNVFCKKNNCSFATMTGDNIYPEGADGLKKYSNDTQRFRLAFEEPYGDFKRISDDFRFYMALGNHDWYTSRTGALAQINYAKNTPPFYMDNFFYSIKPPAGKGNIELFIIDTEMMLSQVKGQYYNIKDDGTPWKRGNIQVLGTKEAIAQNAAEEAQLEWLTNAMKASSARWKIVVAHHPLWESKGSKHGELLALRSILRPIVCQYADAYFSGHQHTLEVHQDSCAKTKRPNKANPLLHVVSGAAGKARSVHKGYIAWQAKQYPQLATKYAAGDLWGFVYTSISNESLEISVHTTPQYQRDPEKYTEQFSMKMEK